MQKQRLLKFSHLLTAQFEINLTEEIATEVLRVLLRSTSRLVSNHELRCVLNENLQTTFRTTLGLQFHNCPDKLTPEESVMHRDTIGTILSSAADDIP